MRHAKISTQGRSALFFLLLVVGLGGAGCGPKRVPEEDEAAAIRAKVRTVAIAPPSSATVVVAREQVEEAFLGRTTERLAVSGLRIVGPGIWSEIWRRYAGDVAGVYDASTGEVDQEKYRTVEDATYRELVELHSVDAILYLTVRPVETYGVPVHPRVCGGTAPPYWPGGWFKWGHGASLVRTACLVGYLEDPSGKQYFARHAPIEGIETYDQQTRAVRPRDAIFQDPLVLDRVVEIVLEPLLAAAADRGSKQATANDGAPAAPLAQEPAAETGGEKRGEGKPDGANPDEEKRD
ncbi:MAG: hypothetical protein IPK00_04580 [Deltaproteobacteria bacterium]|nr:hypothetical protein [Deltaproteobacteria bacterium]